MGAALLEVFRENKVTLLCVLLTFCLGTVAGFQGLVARIPGEWAMALKTRYGFLYIVARGAMPAVLYAILHKFQLLSVQNPFYEALILGLGSETFLRSRILLVFKSSPGQPPSEETKGPLDFLFWFQQFFIDGAGNVLARQRMKAISRYYNKPHLRLKQLADNVQANADAMGEQSASAKQAADATYRDYLAAHAKPGQPPLTDKEEQNWNRRLGFALYKVLTINNFEALSEEITR
jgi:hypothetical protein